MTGVLMSRWAKPAVWVLCLMPVAALALRAWQGQLGGNPIEYLTHATGDWTLRFLLLTLAITPARRLLHLAELIRFRRLLGLFAFFYGCLHLAIWIGIDQYFDFAAMWADVMKRRFITVGMLGFLLMVPLAVTSTRGWIRRMGGRRWQLLHRLVYASAAAGVIHYYWLVKSDIREPALYGVILAVLLLLRLIGRRRR